MTAHRPQADHGYWFINAHVTFADAPDGMYIAEHLMPFGDSPPTHIHHREEEIFHIKSGVMRFRVGEAEIVARAGDTVVAPRGVPHTFRVDSLDGARVLVITNARDFAALVHEFGRPADHRGLPGWQDMTPDGAERLAEICGRNGLELVGPPMPRKAEKRLGFAA